jgi:hypothetical protein
MGAHSRAEIGAHNELLRALVDRHSPKARRPRRRDVIQMRGPPCFGSAPAWSRRFYTRRAKESERSTPPSRVVIHGPRIVNHTWRSRRGGSHAGSTLTPYSPILRVRTAGGVLDCASRHARHLCPVSAAPFSTWQRSVWSTFRRGLYRTRRRERPKASSESRQPQGSEWTHFSVYEVWDNIRHDEIAELEGVLRHIYCFDSHANRLNLAKGYNKLGNVRRQAA